MGDGSSRDLPAAIRSAPEFRSLASPVRLPGRCLPCVPPRIGESVGRGWWPSERDICTRALYRVVNIRGRQAEMGARVRGWEA